MMRRVDKEQRTVTVLTALAVASTPNEVVTALHMARRELGELADVYKPLLESMVLRSNEVHQLKDLAGRDELTGAANRRAFYDVLDREVARHNRRGHSFSVMVLDLDGLKTLNDTHGHSAGDIALVSMARACMGTLRNTDFFARLGGDEFAVLVTDSSPEDAETIAKRLRGAIESMSVAGQPLRVSIGLATAKKQHVSAARLLEEADNNLYQDKRSRRGKKTRHIPRRLRHEVDPQLASQMVWDDAHIDEGAIPKQPRPLPLSQG